MLLFVVKEIGCYIIGGFIFESDFDGKLYNILIFFGFDGVMFVKYRKVSILIWF